MPEVGVEVTNEHGTFQLTRAEESQNFVCDRCLKPKQSRVSVWWHETATDRTKTICIAVDVDVAPYQIGLPSVMRIDLASRSL